MSSEIEFFDRPGGLGPGSSPPTNSQSSAKLFLPMPGMVASSSSCALCRSSSVRMPLSTKASAARRVRPRRSHALDLNQYSSNDEALRLIVLDKLPSPDADASLELGAIAAESIEAIQPAIDLTAEWSIRDIARAHEAVINVAPGVAVPAARSLTGHCILKVGVARRAGARLSTRKARGSTRVVSSELSQVHPDAGRTVPLSSGHRAFHTRR